MEIRLGKEIEDMKFIDKELIRLELKRDIENGFVFTYKKLSNRFLDWLFHCYYCIEQCDNFYDSEPLKYNEWNELQRTSDGRAKLSQAYRDYELERMNFCNWQEPRFAGNWGLTQRSVDKWAKVDLKKTRDIPDSKRSRIYFTQKDDVIRIYFYGRDLLQYDQWFIFKRK
jgi:hypothetical protein